MWSVGVIVPLREIYKPESALTHWVRRVPAYGAAVLASGAALGLSLLIPSIADKPFFLLFFLATAGCAWLFGIASGLTSIVLNTLALIYFVLLPRHSLRLADTDDVVRLSVFVIASGAIAWAMARLRSTQQALTLAQERFELAHEIAKIWSWELDLATGKVTWSSTVKRRAGQHEDPVQIWLELVHADDRDRVMAALKRAVETGKPYEVEFRATLPDGSLRWIASSGEFYKNPKGQQRMIGVNVDITVRKQTEKALEAAAKGELAGELAHQINNPMQGLMHALYLLHQQVSGSELTQYSGVAQSEAERVSQLVKEILRLYSEPRRAF